MYHPVYLLHEPGIGRPERPARLEAIMNQLRARRLLEASQVIDPAPADEKWRHQVHTKKYLKHLAQSAETAPIYLDPDTALSARRWVGRWRRTREHRSGCKPKHHDNA